MIPYIIGFYVGAGATTAFSLCFIIWLWIRSVQATNDAYDDGVEAGLAHDAVRPKVAFVSEVGRN